MLFLDVIQSTWDDSIMEHYISDKILESQMERCMAPCGQEAQTSEQDHTRPPHGPRTM